MNRPGFLIAAPASGSGKTTVSLAVMAALTRRGVPVTPFKCGPDFIDPGYHRLVTGTPSRNLDAWMCDEEFIVKNLQTSQPRQAGLKAVTVIEGAMGLFDGFGSSAMDGSSARIAALTGAPVVLVINARGMAASAAALINGFAAFNPQVKIAGVIFNNVGSESHAELLRDVVAQHCDALRCFGCIPRDEALVIPSRHLGLVTANDNPLTEQFVQHLADMAEKHLDLDALMKLELHTPGIAFMPPPVHDGFLLPRIAVAADQAFCFCYDDNLRLLVEAGSNIVPFSPLNDTSLPPDIAGIYLPGGYPELYAETLSSNRRMCRAVNSAVNDGMPVYAECGGFIYLTEGMADGADFAGVFPVRTRMLPKRKALGYREVVLAEHSCIGAAGAVCRGHEFHYSEIEAMPETINRCYTVYRKSEITGTEGYQVNNCLGSYIHLHFGSNPAIAPAFVAACRRYRDAI